jgi:hypothetical protein
LQLTFYTERHEGECQKIEYPWKDKPSQATAHMVVIGGLLFLSPLNNVQHSSNLCDWNEKMHRVAREKKCTIKIYFGY